MDTVGYVLMALGFCAFFSGMEAAYLSVDKLRFEMERKQGFPDKILSYFFRNPNDFISTMLVGNTLALVVYGILTATLVEAYLPEDLAANHWLLMLLQVVIASLLILMLLEFLA